VRTIGKFLLLGVCVGLCLAAFLLSQRAGESRSDVVEDLHREVEGKIEALRLADYEAAYGRTARAIKVRFDIDEFKGMLVSHYHPVLAAERIEFGTATFEHGRARLLTYLIDEGEVVTPCVYPFIHEGAEWRIAGVVIKPTWPVEYRLGGGRAVGQDRVGRCRITAGRTAVGPSTQPRRRSRRGPRLGASLRRSAV